MICCKNIWHVYELNVKDALAASKSLTVKLEDGILKLYDAKGNLIEKVKV